jgi:peptidylprolyl isomerase
MRSGTALVLLAILPMFPWGRASAGAQTPSLGEILAASPAADWRPLDPDNTLYLELPGGRVIIELSPDFSPRHVANVRALARAHYWDGAAIVRVQDDYVAQWGWSDSTAHPHGDAVGAIDRAEYDRVAGSLPFTPLPDPDSYAPFTGFTNGFPAGRDSTGRTWMLHCYGAVGVARGSSPDNGSGRELYVVIGQSPRHLDRNVAMIGRVVRGIELLSALPRGTGALGFYATAAERTPITSIRVASELPAAERTPLEALRTESGTFQKVVASRRFRREEWFVQPTGHINVCNVPLPVRAMTAR